SWVPKYPGKLLNGVPARAMGADTGMEHHAHRALTSLFRAPFGVALPTRRRGNRVDSEPNGPFRTSCVLSRTMITVATRKSRGEAADSHCSWTIHFGPFPRGRRIDGPSFRDQFPSRRRLLQPTSKVACEKSASVYERFCECFWTEALSLNM